MDFEKYTERAKGFVQAAQNLALRENHQQFSAEHILKVLLDDEQGLASGLIKTAGGDPKVILADVAVRLGKFPKVEGSGAGKIYLAPETARVFDRFWRADPSRQRTTGGTGLGLAIAQEDARAHGGFIDVWSAPGQGSCFRLTLPRHAGHSVTHSPLGLPAETTLVDSDGVELGLDEPAEVS